MKRKIEETRKRTAKVPQYLQEYEYTSNKKPRSAHKKELSSNPSSITNNNFFKIADTDKNTTHYHLNDRHDIENLARKRKIVYIKPTKPSFIKFQNILKIAPVNILQTKRNSQALGVYTTKPIWIKPNSIQVIGHYVGNLLEDNEESPDSSFVFELPNGQIIDASTRCNFTAIINGALSEQTSNIKIQTCQTPSGEHFVEYYLHGGENGLYIQSGSQLLGFYGSTEKYDDYQFGKKFLTTRDLSLTSAELHAKYNQYNVYNGDPQTVDARFSLLFNINPSTLFAIPNDSLLTDCFDIPYLAYKPNSTQFLNQNLQENFTPLMLACWQGNISKITRLLNNGADPNIPSSNLGYTSFHTTMLSPLNSDIKMLIINMLLQPRNAPIPRDANYSPILDIIKSNLTIFENTIHWCCIGNLTAQDKYEKTIAHIAIEQADLDLLSFLLHKDPSFWNFQDNNGHDILETAIISGSLDIINFLLENIRGLKNTNIEIYQQIIDYHSNKQQRKNPLFSALECLYNTKNDDLSTIEAIYNSIRENFNANLTSTQQKQLASAFRRATTKYTTNPHPVSIFATNNKELNTGSELLVEIQNDKKNNI